MQEYADPRPYFHNTSGRHQPMQPHASASSLACYHTELDSGQWSFADHLPIAQELHVHIPEHARVQLLWHRSETTADRHIHMHIGASAVVHCDIMDTSAMGVDLWNIHIQAHGTLTINHALNTTQSREHTVTVNSQEHSHMRYHCALYLQAQARVAHRMYCSLSQREQAFWHHVHGVAAEEASGIIESFVHMLPGSNGAESQQLLKTFMHSKHAAWRMQPDLVIDHEDVRASHGACHGVIAPEWLAYAAARGLEQNTFRALYLCGFLLSALHQPSAQMRQWCHETPVHAYV